MLDSKKDKTFVIYFDEVITRTRTSAVAEMSHERTDLYIKNNLNSLERLKAYLDTLHFKGYRLIIINYMEKRKYDTNEEYYGKNLIKRYLDIAFGDNRLYLHDDAIYISSSKNYIKACAKNICGIFQHEEMFCHGLRPINNSPIEGVKNYFILSDNDLQSDIDESIINLQTESALFIQDENNMQTEASKLIESFWSNAIFFAPTQEALTLQQLYPKAQCQIITVSENISHFDRLSELVNFKHVFYTINYAAIDKMNQIQVKNAELKRTSVNHHMQMQKFMGDNLKIKIVLEVSNALLKHLKELLNISEKDRNITALKENYQKTILDIKERFIQQVDTVYTEQNSKEKILQDFNELFEQVTIQKGTDYSNIAIRKAIISYEKEIEKYINMPELYQAQQQQSHEKMQQVEAEKMRQIAIREQLDEQLRNQNSVLIDSANELSKVCINNNLEKFKLFQNEMVGLNWIGLKKKEFINTIDDAIGLAPLHIACRFGYIDFAQHLIKNEADLELKTMLGNPEKGFQSLHEAIQGQHLNIARLLLEKGANPNGQGSDGRSPLYTAVWYGCSLEFFELLIKHGADVNITDNSALTPLHLAAQMGNTDLVRYFLNYTNIQYFAKSKRGETALVLAIKSNQLAVILQFMDKGITITHQEHKQLLTLRNQKKDIANNITAGLKLLFETPYRYMCSSLEKDNYAENNFSAFFKQQKSDSIKVDVSDDYKEEEKIIKNEETNDQNFVKQFL